jgi:hypothetical protein
LKAKAALATLMGRQTDPPTRGVEIISELRKDKLKFSLLRRPMQNASIDRCSNYAQIIALAEENGH